VAGGAKQQASATALVVGEIEINICQKFSEVLTFLFRFLVKKKMKIGYRLISLNDNKIIKIFIRINVPQLSLLLQLQIRHYVAERAA
jgi:hypothetical protein